MRIRLDISYDGHNFKGFQRQIKERTVQQEIETVLSRIFNTDIVISASGRTDAGVHALKQVVTFMPNKEVSDLALLRYSLNRMLPNDIHVNAIQFVDDSFHPRLHALLKTYKYILNMGEANPFYENYRYEFKRKLDVNKVLEAKELFVGEHNFKNFTTKEEDNHDYVRTINSIDVKQDEDVLEITLIGNGFMRYMVRMIVGTLIAIGIGKEDKNFIVNKLEDTNRMPVIYKAPPQGLYLVDVKYEGDV
mgnify:FL=1